MNRRFLLSILLATTLVSATAMVRAADPPYVPHVVPGFSSRAEGGLGLARSREMLAFWRGRLELLDTEPGVGSTFRIEIPPAKQANRKD